MYGTIARLKIKPGSLPQLQALGQQAASGDRLKQSGHVATYMYQSNDDPDEVWMVVMFDSKDAYYQNAESPEQNTEFTQMSQFFAAPPEWHDGNVIWTSDAG